MFNREGNKHLFFFLALWLSASILRDKCFCEIERRRLTFESSSSETPFCIISGSGRPPKAAPFARTTQGAKRNFSNGRVINDPSVLLIPLVGQRGNENPAGCVSCPSEQLHRLESFSLGPAQWIDSPNVMCDHRDCC